MITKKKIQTAYRQIEKSIQKKKAEGVVVELRKKRIRRILDRIEDKIPRTFFREEYKEKWGIKK